MPVYPRVDVDFSVLARADHAYADIAAELAGYDHPLLRRLAFLDCYEGGSVPAGQRSFTFRATIGDPDARSPSRTCRTSEQASSTA